jgi:hypothetical protein
MFESEASLLLQNGPDETADKKFDLGHFNMRALAISAEGLGILEFRIC